MPIKKHITAGCFLIRKNQKATEVLLIYKLWSENNQGWTFPKGHVELNETLTDTAIRETREETGYTDFTLIKAVEPLNIVYEWNDGYTHHKAIHYFIAKLNTDIRVDLKLEEGERATQLKTEWFDLATACKNLLFDDERELLLEVKKYSSVLEI